VSATARLLEFAAAEHRLPEGARAAAQRLLADTLMVGAAGAWQSGACGLDGVVRSWGEGSEARPIGAGRRLPAPSAAYLNGFRIHCLEWDAVHEGAVVHALSVVTAALGAVIDRRGGCDPDAALVALAVGVDVASGLGLASSGAMRFFRPATMGVIGAALACARIDGTPAADVLGLAYSQAAGTMQAHVEGSIALPLQIAHAARAAVTAVDLAKAGLSGPRDSLEGPFGFFSLVEEGRLSSYADGIGARWLMEEVSTKPYPSGRASHAMLAALADFGPGAAEIEEVVAYLPPLVRRLVDRPVSAGMTPAYARLCLPFLTALMMRDGAIDPRRFTPGTFADPALADLARKVRVQADENDDPNALTPQRLVIDTGDGRHDIEIEHVLGSPGAPLSPEQAEAKRSLTRELAGELPDPRLFDDPLSYFTEPR
jgi:2-methylcitrate dehydratase PrpD